MLINNSRLENCPILSLHVGGPVGRVVEVIVDPDPLKVIAFRVDGPLVGKEVGDILPIASVREYSQLGIIVDSTDEFVEADTIVRVDTVLKLNFSLIGLKVKTERKTHLGKVSGFTIEPESWQVQQLIVQRPVLKSFFDPELTISRQQIAEIDDYTVVVKDNTAKSKAAAQTVNTDNFVPDFINPFRKPDLVPETQDLAPETQSKDNPT